jgi:hypothetical protein
MTNMMKNIENFWDENYYENPPLSEEMIKEAEARLAVKLPESYISLLNIQNGGYTQGYVFPMSEKTSWSSDHVPFDQLFGIVTDEDSASGHNILDTDYLAEEWGLPSNNLVLTGRGHWWITLDYSANENPSVRWIDVECDENILLANSFEDFINGLIPKSVFLEE